MNRKKITIIVLITLLLSAFSFSLSWGSYEMSFTEILNTFLGNGTKMQNFAIFTLRLPRTILAMLVASALAVAGALLQGITQNDLADAGIIGINSGASLGAVVFIFFGGNVYYEAMSDLSIFALPIVALCGALISSYIIYRIACYKVMRPKRLLLSGIGIGIAINSIITYLTFKSNGSDYNRVLVWTNGSLWGSGWKYVLAILPIVLIVLSLVLYSHKTLDVLCLGDELACGLGVDPNKERKRFLIYAVLLAGSATAFAGNISFLGLLGPHLARKLVGPKHKNYLPIAIIISIIVILVADTLSRNLFSPLEIPVGITISLVGVPYFIYLMGKEK